MAVYVKGRSISPPPSYDEVLREDAAARKHDTNGSYVHPLPLSGSVPELPVEMLSYIMQYLSVSDRKDAALVCKKWYEASLAPQVQRDVMVSVKSSIINPRPFTGLRNRPGFHLELSDINGSPNSEQLLKACEVNLSSRLLTLSLKGSNVSQSVLVAMLDRCSNLTSLDVSGCNNLTFLGSGCGKHLTSLSLPHLQSLDLSSLRHLTDAILTAFLRMAPGLRSLELASTPFLFSSSDIYSSGSNGRPNSAALTFNRFLHELSYLHSLISLNLSRTSISNSALIALAKVPKLALESLLLVSCKDLTDAGIIALVQEQPSLRKLNLSSNSQLSAVSVKYAATLQLDSLNLTKVRLYGAELRPLEKLGRITHLVLSASVLQHLPASEVEKLFHVWSQPLRHLDLSYCAGLSNAVFFSLCHHLVNLTQLNLSSCFRFDDITLREISKCLVNLRGLNISWCKHITDMGLFGVFHTDFTHNCTNECRCDKGRSVSYFEYTPPVKDIAPREIVPDIEQVHTALAEQGGQGQFPITRLRKLESLDLSVCSKITDLGVAETLIFPSLVSLNLSMCTRLTDASLMAIVANNPLLERVSLAQCREITDRGVFDLLVDCRRLSHLDISGCRLITDSTIHALMKQESKLKSLDVSLCNISMEAIDTLERFLPSIHTIHKRYTQANDIQPLIRKC